MSGRAPKELDAARSSSPENSPRGPVARRTRPRAGPVVKPKPSNQQTQNQVKKESAATANASAASAKNRAAKVVKKFTIGTDYGTTFTAVSFLVGEHGINDSELCKSITSICSWPEDPLFHTHQVPSEIWYSEIAKKRKQAIGQYDREILYDTDDEESGIPLLLDSEEENEVESYDLMRWGYEVEQNSSYQSLIIDNEYRRIARAKLYLLDSKHTREDRDALRPRIQGLIASKLIRKYGKRAEDDPRDVQDVIADFLVPLWNFTKEHLVKHRGLEPDSQVCFNITVPVHWAPRASRIFRAAIEDAIRESGFGQLKHGAIENLFIVTEPEAALTYLMAKYAKEFEGGLAGKHVLIFDAGGGTVDVSTYTLDHQKPPRLDTEVGVPDGDNCGSAYLNLRYQQHMEGRLKSQNYLVDKERGINIESIATQLTKDFERRKRWVNIYDVKTKETSMPIPYLKVNNELRFRANGILINREDFRIVFEPILKRCKALLEKQLDECVKLRKIPKTVFLIGGFGQNPSLQECLRRALAAFRKSQCLKEEITLITTEDSDAFAAVSKGAILRGLDVENGPERSAYESYGYLRREVYREKKLEHEDTFIEEGDDGLLYVHVIEYFINVGDIVPASKKFIIQCSHEFDVTDFDSIKEKLIAEEVLYVADKPMASGYNINHAINKGAQIAGKIRTNLSSIYNSGQLESVYSMRVGRKLKKLATIEYDLRITIQGRNLKFEALYPSGKGGKVIETKQFCITSAFLPGTN